MKKLLALTVLFCLVSCTDETRTRETLRKSGFTDVEITGYSWAQCGEGDDFHTGFSARNPNGTRVEGTVCCGFTKGCTIRF